MSVNRLPAYFAPLNRTVNAPTWKAAFIPCPAALVPPGWALPLYEAAYASAQCVARSAPSVALYTACWN